MAMESKIVNIIKELSACLIAKKIFLVTAESCTGGMVSTFCTSQAGSSAWFYGAFVTYHNQAKVDFLGVKEQTLKQFGAVSKQTVEQMCAGALNKSKADCVIAVSGVAGPGGGTEINPVGSVWIGVQIKGNKARISKYHFSGNRESIRKQTVYQSLKNLLLLLA